MPRLRAGKKRPGGDRVLPRQARAAAGEGLSCTLVITQRADAPRRTPSGSWFHGRDASESAGSAVLTTTTSANRPRPFNVRRSRTDSSTGSSTGGLDNQEIEIAVGPCLASRMRAKQDHLRLRRRGGQPPASLGYHHLVEHALTVAPVGDRRLSAPLISADSLACHAATGFLPLRAGFAGACSSAAGRGAVRNSTLPTTV